MKEVIELDRKQMYELIVEKAREYFKGHYAKLYADEQGNINYEIYTDYHDELNEDTIKQAFEHGDYDVEKAKEYLNNYIFDMFVDVFCDKEYDLAKEVIDHLQNKLDSNTLELLEGEGLIEPSEIREILMDYGVVSVFVDEERILSRSEIELIILMENHNSKNHEFSLNDFNGNLLEWIERTQELLDDGEVEEKDISLISLLKSQGYTFKDFKSEVRKCEASSTYKPNSKFIRSLIDECENTMSSCNALVFLTKCDLSDYLNGNPINTIDKSFDGGYVDFVFGGGSVIGITLEKDIPLHSIANEKFIDSKRYGYSFREIFGDFIR